MSGGRAATVDTLKDGNYSLHMTEILQTATFARWLRELKDRQARARIQVRIDRLAEGNPGQVRVLRHGVTEMKLSYGPGYRVYYAQRGMRLILLLCGGDKSTQAADIQRAYALAQETENEK